ncbi:MAG TPA: class I SAM-dependent methyltransferase, partial [Acidimicrobiales bacterium]|nr:class I SAM-dependent methyltransferase [Acidimicrobiales bacterium]
MTIALEREVDPERLRDFVSQAVGEVGATLNTALVVLGDRLGLYRGLAGAGPLTPVELASRTGTAVRYVQEWLCSQAAGGFVEYDPDTARFSLPPEQAVALTDEASPYFLPGLFQFALGAVIGSSRITDAARTGEGAEWDTQGGDVHEGCERFSRPAYSAHLTTSWLPALDGVVSKLEAGAVVADVGCGRGASTELMAQAYPNSRFVGSDQHAPSIDVARDRAESAGFGTRLRYEVTPAAALTGGPYDLV